MVLNGLACKVLPFLPLYLSVKNHLDQRLHWAFIADRVFAIS